MKRVMRSVALCAALMTSTIAFGQTAGDKKSHQFHGKVEAVNADSLKVNGDKVEGWMDAMTMNYKVDDKKVLKTVKPGDEITATVYDGDFASLHKVQVVSKKK